MWVDYHTAANQEWLIRVENETNEIPWMVLACGVDTVNTEGGIKIRLRGKGEGEHIIKRDTPTNA